MLKEFIILSAVISLLLQDTGAEGKGNVELHQIDSLANGDSETTSNCEEEFWCGSVKSLCNSVEFIREKCKSTCDMCRRGEDVHCPDIESIQYGDFRSSSRPPYKVGTVANFSCDTGFKGIGTKSIVCLGNGRWSGPIPYCTAFTCRRDLNKLEEGQICRKKCKKHRECRGQFKKCECDGWCGKSCYNPNAECPKLSEPLNGYITGDRRTYGRTVTYGCDDGYTLSASSTRRCMSNKKWSGHPPLCVPFSACGQSSEQRKPSDFGKVTDGSDAKQGSWPWQVALIHSRGYSVDRSIEPKRVFGGGSVINEEWILSAAHLFTPLFSQNLQVQIWNDTFLLVLGMTSFPNSQLLIPEHIQIFDPETVYMHPNFDNTSFDYDVALIRIGKRMMDDRSGKFVVDDSTPYGKLTFSRFVRPVCLPCMSGDRLSSIDVLKNFVNQSCNTRTAVDAIVTVTGFGITNYESKSTPDNLQEGRLKIMDDWKCSEYATDIRSRNAALRYTKRMFCASSANKTKKTDSCKGDSGGPVVRKINHNNQASYWLQLGIVSWGIGCGGQYPGFYTSVAAVTDWVWKTMSSSTKEITCSPPRLKSNQELSNEDCLEKQNINSTCSVRCDKHFRFRGILKKYHVMQCKLNPDHSTASWGPSTIPDCEEITCNKSGYPFRSYRFNTTLCERTVALGSKCPITCSRGYKFRSGENIWFTSCNLKLDESLEADWFPRRPPFCYAITCSRFRPLNLAYRYDTSLCGNTTLGSKCEITCANGYKFNKRERIWTTSCHLKTNNPLEADWIPKHPPNCHRIYCRPIILGRNQESDLISCNWFSEINSICPVRCKQGFKFSGTNATVLNQQCRLNSDAVSASWAGQTLPECEAITCNRFRPLNSMYRYNTTLCGGTTLGSKCEISCANGYKFNTRERIWTTSCQLKTNSSLEADWIPTRPPICNRIYCRPIPERNQDIVFASCNRLSAINAICAVRCKRGFKFSGTNATVLYQQCRLNVDAVSASWAGQTLPECDGLI